MRLPRRRFLHLAAGAAALPVVPDIANGQTYPTRPVRLIVPFAPGGSTDIVARLVGQWLSERLGQQFVVENRPGAGSNVGTELVVRAPPDGYTLLMVGAPNAINATLYDKLPFDFIRDIAPIAAIISIPNVMVVSPSLPVKNVHRLCPCRSGQGNHGVSRHGWSHSRRWRAVQGNGAHRHDSRPLSRRRPSADRSDGWPSPGYV